MRIFSFVMAMVASVLVILMLLFGWYQFRTYHIREITVEDCDSAASPCVKRLSKLVDESLFNRPYYEVSANNSNYVCLFFKYETSASALYVGIESASGVIVGTQMTQDQMRQFADTLNPATNTEQVIGYIRILHDKNPPRPTVK